MNYLCQDLINLGSDGWGHTEIILVKLKVNISKLFISGKIDDNTLILLFKFTTNLKELILRCYLITGKCFKYIKNLESLDIYTCSLKEKHLKNFTKLKTLALYNGNISGSCFNSFHKSIESLKIIEFSHSLKFKEKYLIKYTSFPKLKKIDISSEKFTGKCFLNLDNFPSLIEVNCENSYSFKSNLYTRILRSAGVTVIN